MNSSAARVRAAALLPAVALTVAGTVALAGPAGADPVGTATPLCGVTTCTVSYGYTGDTQTFTVPDGVTGLGFDVDGAAGGTSRFRQAGGAGGSVTGTLPVTPGNALTVLVGQVGNTDASGVYGGGGASGSQQYLGTGGGGSFVYSAVGSLLVAAGGGGGGATDGGPCAHPGITTVGGAGSGAESAGGDGVIGCYPGRETAATGGGTTPGAGGQMNFGNGLNGNGPAADFQPGAGGNGGGDAYYAGGGGGGGYFGGGGGGYTQSGAGGSGFVTPAVTDSVSASGVNTGNGVITFSWPAKASSVALTVTPKVDGNPGDADTLTATVSGAGSTPRGTVNFTVDGTALDECPSQSLTDGSASCVATSIQPGDHSITASYSGDDQYGPSASDAVSYTVPLPVGVTTETLPSGTVDSPYSVELAASGVAPFTWSVSSGDLPAGLSLSPAGALSGTPTSATDGTSFGLTVTDSQRRPVSADRTFDLVVAKADQTITFSNPAPDGASVGTTYDATASVGASGNPLDLTVDAASNPANTCSLDGTTLSFDHLGTCVLDAAQSGDADYNPAAAQRLVTVRAIVPATALRMSASHIEFGQRVSSTARVAQSEGGLEQFVVDGDEVGSPLPIAAGAGSASLVLTDADGDTLTPGAHQVAARFTPVDTTRYTSVVSAARTVVVDPARTATAVTVRPTALSATVSRLVRGLAPSGTVTFSVDGQPVGSAAVVGGSATLPYGVATGQEHDVAAVFAGTTGFLGSSDSTSRNDPSITATITSRHAVSRTGWYGGPVTVTFVCVTGGAPLARACPAPVVLSRSAAGQSVTRTISATDGGSATAAVTGIDVDRTAPTSRVTGVVSGRSYFMATPPGRCVGDDALSGVTSCTLRHRVNGHRVVYTATVTDRAGNRSASTLVAYRSSIVLVGVPSHDGVYAVRVAHRYVLHVRAARTPHYVAASLAPHRPRGRGAAFHRLGHDEWELHVSIDRRMRGGRLWELGVQVGRRVYVVEVRVVR